MKPGPAGTGEVIEDPRCPLVVNDFVDTVMAELLDMGPTCTAAPEL